MQIVIETNQESNQINHQLRTHDRSQSPTFELLNQGLPSNEIHSEVNRMKKKSLFKQPKQQNQIKDIQMKDNSLSGSHLGTFNSIDKDDGSG